MTVAMLSMTMAFAENEKENAVVENALEMNVENVYDMSVNMRKLSVALGLAVDQIEAVETVHNTFNAEMLFAAHYSTKEEREAQVKKAVEKDIKWMNYILTKDQYRKYLLLLNTTLNNRGLNK
jgi:replicative superfamily II helicase